MNNYPKLPHQFIAERTGVLKIASLLNERGLIFRETAHTDVGLDGQIEYVNELGEVTGQLVAVQIKSGDSYLNDRKDHWAYYPNKKHRSYWANYPLSVILFIYSPSNSCTYFTDVTKQLNGQDGEGPIKIAKNNIFELTSRDDLFSGTENAEKDFLKLAELLNEMISRKCTNPTFNISFFDLFVQGLTNICRHLFFSMSLAVDIAEYNNDTEFGLSLGYKEYEFLHDYAKFLLSQNLAKIDYDDYLVDWKERELVPTFHVPITQRGRLLMGYITEQETKMDTQIPARLVSEMSLGRIYLPSDYHRMAKARYFVTKYVE